jgi:2'-5' RNA ligase
VPRRRSWIKEPERAFAEVVAHGAALPVAIAWLRAVGKGGGGGMNYLAVAYPRLTEEDTAWIQAIRKQYDPNVNLIAPHVTLIFPTAAEHARGLLEDVRQQVPLHAAFPFVIRCALPVRDVLSESTHVFFVPDEGFSSLVRLHDALYARSLAATRRLDIPFIPHITVGATSTPEAAKEIVDLINSQDRSIHGIIDRVSAITFNGQSVELSAEFPLSRV